MNVKLSSANLLDSKKKIYVVLRVLVGQSHSTFVELSVKLLTIELARGLTSFTVFHVSVSVFFLYLFTSFSLTFLFFSSQPEVFLVLLFVVFLKMEL